MRHNKLLLMFILPLLFTNQAAYALPDDQEKTIHLQADHSSFDQKNGVIIYAGSAQLTQGSLQINADKITVHYSEDKSINKIEATGSPAMLQQQPQLDEDIITASAQSIFYLHQKNTVELLKNAELTQAGAIMYGHKIQYDLAKEIVRAEAGDNAEERIKMTIPANAIQE